MAAYKTTLWSVEEIKTFSVNGKISMSLTGQHEQIYQYSEQTTLKFCATSVRRNRKVAFVYLSASSLTSQKSVSYTLQIVSTLVWFSPVSAPTISMKSWGKVDKTHTYWRKEGKQSEEKRQVRKKTYLVLSCDVKKFFCVFSLIHQLCVARTLAHWKGKKLK